MTDPARRRVTVAHADADGASSRRTTVSVDGATLEWLQGVVRRWWDSAGGPGFRGSLELRMERA